MQVSIVFRHVDSNEAIKEHVEDKMKRLAHFFSKEPVKVHVVLSESKLRYEVEVVVSGDNLSLTYTEEGTDFYAAVDQVYHKLEQKLRRHKDKVKDHKGHRGEFIEPEEGL